MGCPGVLVDGTDRWLIGILHSERQELREESDLLRQYGHKLALCVGIVADAARVNEA